jgi:integrase
MGKRGNNEGSIYRDADGRWRAALHIRYQDGKRKRKKFGGKTRAAVAAKIAAALRDQQLGLPVVSEKMTIQHFLRIWLEQAAKPKLRSKTYTSYSQLIENHLIPALGLTHLPKLTAQMVGQILNSKRADGLSGRTVQYIHAVLRRALNQAVRWDMVSRNVATLVDAPKAVRREVTPYTRNEARQFLVV